MWSFYTLKITTALRGISTWLPIPAKTKTLGKKKKEETMLAKQNLKEHIFYLLTLQKYACEGFA